MEGGGSPDNTEIKAEIASEQPVEAEPVGIDQLNNWIETGLSDNAVAVYGTSVEVLQQILDTGIIPPMPGNRIRGEHMKALRERGKYLYYFTPFYTRIKSSHPEIAQKLKDYANETDERLEEVYSVDDALNLTRRYAFPNAVKDYFEAQTGMRPDEEIILAIAYDNDYKAYLAEMRGPSKNTPYEILLKEGLDAQQDGERDDEIEDLQNSIDNEKLHKVAQECFRRRGVFLYFDQKVLLPSTDQGELGPEIITVTDKPLLATAISGIEFLAPADREVVTKVDEKIQ
jgi:hypothetical protein